MAEQVVLIQPDSTGKAVRTEEVTTLVGGVVTTVQQQVVTLSDEDGALTIGLDRLAARDARHLAEINAVAFEDERRLTMTMRAAEKRGWGPQDRRGGTGARGSVR